MYDIKRFCLVSVLVVAAARLAFCAPPTETYPTATTGDAPAQTTMTADEANATASTALAIGREFAKFQTQENEAMAALQKKNKNMDAKKANAARNAEWKRWIEKRNALQKKYAGETKSFETLMNSFFKSATDKYPQLVKKNGRWVIDRSSGQFIWKDAAGEDIVQATINLHKKQSPEALARMPKLANKYPIQSQSDSFVYVWAGQIQVVLTPAGFTKADITEWKKKDRLLEAVQNLFDLDAMSKIDAE